MRYHPALSIVAATLLAACVTPRETSPPRTATEQLLISSAADRAAERLALSVPARTKVFVDITYFEGIDAKYAIGAVREHLLRAGSELVTDRSMADVVIELRSGALSTDERDVLLGIPELEVPIPLSGDFTIPEIALFSKKVRQGVAKFAATSYGADDGAFVSASGPQFGSSHITQWRVLLFFGWKTTDVMRSNAPKTEAPGPASAASQSAKPTPGWR
jgi:hypothetical protein